MKTQNAAQFAPNQQKTTKKGRFHELTFDDTLDTERIYLHSSYDFNIDVQNERTADIHDSHDLVTLHAEKNENANQVITLTQGNRTVTLNKGHHLHTLLQGDMTKRLMQGNQSEILSQGDKLVALTAGNEMHTIGGNFGLACNQIGIVSGGVMFSASSGGAGAGNVTVAEAASSTDAHGRTDGNALPAITPPTNPGNNADESKVIAKIDQLDVETTLTNGNMSLEISGGNRKTTISGNETVKIGGNYTLEVDGDLTLTVTGDLKISAANINSQSKLATAVKAGTSIDLTATTTWGGAGLSVDLSAQTTLTAAGNAQATVQGGGMLSLAGGVVKIN